MTQRVKKYTIPSVNFKINIVISTVLTSKKNKLSILQLQDGLANQDIKEEAGCTAVDLADSEPSLHINY